MSEDFKLLKEGKKHDAKEREVKEPGVSEAAPVQIEKHDAKEREIKESGVSEAVSAQIKFQPTLQDAAAVLAQFKEHPKATELSGILGTIVLPIGTKKDAKEDASSLPSLRAIARDKILEYLKKELNALLSNPANDSPKVGSVALRDAAHQALLAMARYNPATTQSLAGDDFTEENWEERVFSSDGYQFDMGELVYHHNTRDYQSQLGETYERDRVIINPYTRLPFSDRDTAHILNLAKARGRVFEKLKGQDPKDQPSDIILAHPCWRFLQQANMATYQNYDRLYRSTPLSSLHEVLKVLEGGLSRLKRFGILTQPCIDALLTYPQHADDLSSALVSLKMAEDTILTQPNIDALLVRIQHITVLHIGLTCLCVGRILTQPRINVLLACPQHADELAIVLDRLRWCKISFIEINIDSLLANIQHIRTLRKGLDYLWLWEKSLLLKKTCADILLAHPQHAETLGRVLVGLDSDGILTEPCVAVLLASPPHADDLYRNLNALKQTGVLTPANIESLRNFVQDVSEEEDFVNKLNNFCRELINNELASRSAAVAGMAVSGMFSPAASGASPSNQNRSTEAKEVKEAKESKENKPPKSEPPKKPPSQGDGDSSNRRCSIM